MSDIVLQDLDNGLLTITMNRPDRRNALNPEMTEGLVAAARRAQEDHEVRAVLIKGAGGTFCVGGDVKSMAAGRAPLPFEAKRVNLRKGMEVSRILHTMAKPVVAQLDGAAAGAGLSIALSCDLRVASSSVKITTAFAKVGFSGDYGGTYFLTKMLGSAKARELYLMSPVLTAQEALGLGMVTKVVDDAEVETAARELAMSLARGPSITYGYIKTNINNAETMTLEACFDGESMHHTRCSDTEDHKEAAKAFVEKRKPVFKGNDMSEMRLRQVCLVAPHLEPVVSDITAILGLDVCYRDPHVEKYGLENALMPVDATLLEVVAPTQPGTAAGRFLDKSGGRGGYMVILSCEDPDERGRFAASIGVRTANVIDHPPYHGVQLHPRDCRAAFIEFNHTAGSDDGFDIYPPAGPNWQESIRHDVTRALLEVELQSPDHYDLAQHWSNLIGIPLTSSKGNDPQIAFPNGCLRFTQGKAEAMTGLTFRVNDVAQVLGKARARGCPSAGDAFLLGGVTFRVVA